jgi:dienelactone hydrolase
MAARLQALADPQPGPVPPLPALAHDISGKTYTLQANPMEINAFTLDFTQEVASIKVYTLGGTQEYAIGLDGVSRFTQGVAQPGSPPPSPVALAGSWVSDDTFDLSLYQGGNLTGVRFVFKDQDVAATIQNALGVVPVSGTSKTAAYPSPSGETTLPGQNPYSSEVQVETAGGKSQAARVNYLLYLPDSYGQDPQRKWPLILFLHGRGERGDDLDRLKVHPLPKTLETETDFPFIVVSPQLPLEFLAWSSMIDPLDALLDQLQAIYAVDPKRIYLTGLSMGGYGAWEFVLRYPRRFAAAVPIAGGYEGPRAALENICDLRQVPLWVFHGASDTIVPPSESEVLVEALQACGGNVRFTLYPDADHESSFYQAYADPELYQWLARQTLK